MEERYLKEDIKIFENSLSKLVNERLKYLEESLFSITDKTPKIYTVMLDKNNFNYDYVLSEIVEDKKLSIHSTYLDSVFVDYEYFKLDSIENRIYTGYFLIDNEKFGFRYILEKDSRYEKKIKKMYELHINSNTRWYGINKKYIERMYRIKVIGYEDSIENLDDIDKFYVEYNLDEKIYKNIKPYWNVKKENFIVKESITVLDSFSYKYEIEKSPDSYYLVDEKLELIDDVINKENAIEIYSRYPNLYSFNIVHITKINEMIFKDICVNYAYKLENEPSLQSIRRYFKKHNIELEYIKKVDDKSFSLNIPEYNNMIIKKTISYIAIKPIKPYEYFELFNIVNILNLNLYMYEVVVYE